jgi:L-asparaginase/Glu-tRNA(Gln) amidotransferase subunit D
VLPHIPDLKRVIYTIYEYDPLLDSSNMTMDDWIQVGLESGWRHDIQHNDT